MKLFSKILMGTILFSLTATAQIKNAKTEIVKVNGNCDMCKSTIEKAASQKNISKAQWDKNSKMLTLTYDGTKTDADALLKKVAYAGYDNEKYLAPKEAYENLPGCCQYDRLQTQTSKAGSHAGHQMAEATSVMQKQNILEAVYNSYFQLKDALVKSDKASASANAKVLSKALKDAPMDKMENTQHNVWMKVLPKLQEDAQHIADAKDIKHQRERFATLSAKMYEVAKAFDVSETIYYQKCPMYNDGKGANWLSKDVAIKNPYYGSAMLSCGSTIETIK